MRSGNTRTDPRWKSHEEGCRGNRERIAATTHEFIFPCIAVRNRRRGRCFYVDFQPWRFPSLGRDFCIYWRKPTNRGPPSVRPRSALCVPYGGRPIPAENPILSGIRQDFCAINRANCMTTPTRASAMGSARRQPDVDRHQWYRIG